MLLSLQARLLAGQVIDTIASRTGLTPDAIHCYERLLFAVEDARHAPDYLAGQAGGLRGHRSLFTGDTPSLVKVLALGGGPDAVDGVLSYFLSPSVPKDFAHLHPNVLRMLATMVRVEAARLARALPGLDTRPLLFLGLADALTSMSRNDPGVAPVMQWAAIRAEFGRVLGVINGNGDAHTLATLEGERAVANVDTISQTVTVGEPEPPMVGVEPSPIPDALLRRAAVLQPDREAVLTSPEVHRDDARGRRRRQASRAGATSEA